MTWRWLLLALALAWAGTQSGGAPAQSEPTDQADPSELIISCDLAVYGGTPSGVMAAVAAARHGCTVVLIEPSNHVGGVVSGGLVETDIGRRDSVGGLADEFFDRVLQYYTEKYGPESEQVIACRGGIHFEPHVAELLYEQMLAEQPKIKVMKGHRLRDSLVTNLRVSRVALETRAGDPVEWIEAKMFVDASYEGDLMAKLGVPYRVGRESRDEYGECLAGINKGPKEVLGTGDHRTQAYNYRVSLTYDVDNRVLFPKPEVYDPTPWRSYGNRIHREGIEKFADLFVTFDGKAVPNQKIDTNWCDLTGGSEGYADGDWETRGRIEARHRDYFLSLLYYLQNDPSVPEAFREDAQNWGLPLDEFVDNGHFPHQIYVREGRRMLGNYVLKQSDLTTNRYKPDGVCSGSYAIDCHTVQNLLVDGKIVREGSLPGGAVRPYDIPYACLVPCTPENLLVTVCLSSSHVAYSSLRMEPVYMMLGQAAGTAASLAIEGRTTAQAVDTAALRERLRADGAVLDAACEPQVSIVVDNEHPLPGDKVTFRASIDYPGDEIVEYQWNFAGDGEVEGHGQEVAHVFDNEKVYTVSLLVTDELDRQKLVTCELPVGRAFESDVTIDDVEAGLTGRWDPYAPAIFTGAYAHRDKILWGERAPGNARFVTKIPRSGRYAVCLGFLPAADQATDLTVKVKHLDGLSTTVVDQTDTSNPFPFTVLGEYRFKAGQLALVQLSSLRANGRVAIDSARWIWLDD
jgi:hypothetical protein